VTRRAPGRAAARTTASSRDPYGLGPARTFVAPAIALQALVVVAAMTLSLMNGRLPFRSNPGGGNGGGNQGPEPTPAPSNVVIVEPQVTFPGSIVYAKAGNIWIQSGHDVRQLTDSGHDSMPSFSPDGKDIYFIREDIGRGKHTEGGAYSWFDLATPSIVKVPADGSAPPVGIVSGRIKQGRELWFFWMREPVLAPDGHTIALLSDGPSPYQSDVTLQFYDTKTKKFTKPKLSQNGLGHQDPAWAPNGSYLAFVKNARDGARGAPQILKYSPANKKVFAITGPGYIAPAWSPNSRYIAATKTDSFGTDLVILDSGTGNELLRLTNDHHSFSPVWSPAGDAIAFLRLDGAIADLFEVKLNGTPGNWTKGDETQLTEVSGLDAASRPGWFIPPSELPAPSVSPSSPAGSAAPGSAAPASTAP
jgi:Tol biopolymer transport system component